MARKMVCEWGMSDELGPLTFGKKEEQIFLGREISQHQDYSEATAEPDRRRGQAHRAASSYDRALTIITRAERERLVALAEALLEHEMLDAPQIQQLLRGEKIALRVRTAPAAAEPPARAGRSRRPDRPGQPLTPPVAHRQAERLGRLPIIRPEGG